MSKQCEIVQDLLPLYADGACSEASAELIKEHLKTCTSCREICQKMSSHTDERLLQKEKDGVIIRHERKENQRILRHLLLAVAVIYCPALLIAALFAGGDIGLIETPYIFDLMVLFLYTFPCYLAFLELGFFICRAFEKCKRSTGERAFNTIGAILALAIAATAVDLENLLYASLTLAGLLALNRLIAAIVYRKKTNPTEIIRQKTFWIFVVILTLVVAAAIAIPTILSERKKVKEETVESSVSVVVRACGSNYDGIS